MFHNKSINLIIKLYQESYMTCFNVKNNIRKNACV